jgi:hypothetical protein
VKYFFLLLLGIAFLFSSAASAINPSETSPGKVTTAKPITTKQPIAKTIPRETRMRATGIVKDFSDAMLRIERSVTAELMEFSLEKPLDKIIAGDKVTISYIKKEERNIAKRVSKTLPKKKVISSQNGNPTAQPSLPPVKK